MLTDNPSNFYTNNCESKAACFVPVQSAACVVFLFLFSILKNSTVVTVSMPLSWNEIRVRAAAFSRQWRGAAYEKGEMQSFYNDFFGVFGIRRRAVARYEELVSQRLDNSRGCIDLFWPGILIVEQKSLGRSLQEAETQADRYFDALEGADKPRYRLVCDFQTFRLLDRDTGHQWQFELEELPENVEAFGFMLGREPRDFADQDDVSIQAAELMGLIYDGLKDSGYPDQDLERFLVQLVFCLFADDTGIFEPRDIFHSLVLNRTSPDGADTGLWLKRLHEVLNTPVGQRQRNLDEDLDVFPYVDGLLFERDLVTPDFDSVLRSRLLAACEFNWSEISPAIFGSLFQCVMDPGLRRALGAHYTTEENILKVIRPLFLDDLREEFDRICALRRGRRRRRLLEFQRKLGELAFLDPACGCGNFLVIAYRELRQLEIEVLGQLIDSGQLDLDAQSLSLVNVDQFYGIELEEFPARIAETALWMMDHIMNVRLGLAFGRVYTRIPLAATAHIACADALEMEWSEVLEPGRCSYILGNPPFAGSKYQSAAQRAQVHRLAGFRHIKGTLDYVSCWFLKAAAYVRGATRIGLVATSSIVQGEQAGQLWPLIFDRCRLDIVFAHSAFAWTSEARAAAHVHVVIVGLARREHRPSSARLFSYCGGAPAAQESRPKAISPYLAAELERYPYVAVQASKRPVNGFKALRAGSKPIDGGHYIFESGAARDAFLDLEPGAAEFMRPYVGSKDLIQGTVRYILALQEAAPDQLARLPQVRRRIQAVREFRRRSRSAPTLRLAETPRLYHINVLPVSPFLVIPVTSSERREYVPIRWLEPPVIPNIDTRILVDAGLGDFALLTSRMHMVWLRFVGGRLESRYRYSINLVYNVFPRPQGSLDPLEPYAAAVLAERDRFIDVPFAQLYDPDLMPPALRRAHGELDRAVERLYRRRRFASDRERIECLFERYSAYVQPLLVRRRGYRSFGRKTSS